MERIARLHEILATDPDATHRLWAIEQESEFVAALVRFAGEHSVMLSGEEIAQFIAAGRRDWLEQRTWN